MHQLREARSVFNPETRRNLRDEHALNVVLAGALGESSNAIDIGANQGAVLDAIVRVAPNGRHMAFEPIPTLHDELVAKFPQVDIRRVALSDSSGTAEFVHVINDEAFSGLKQREDLPSSAVERISVQTERLDDLLDNGYAPTLIKIDVEGAELSVMKGAVETLQRHRPHVVFEHGQGGADIYGATPGELFDLLASARLRIFDLDGEGPYSRGRFEDTFTQPIWNFLASPS
ncbi:MAG TPA: FkbM family methyltransferase [Thermoleophilaceae bacterium]